MNISNKQPGLCKGKVNFCKRFYPPFRERLPEGQYRLKVVDSVWNECTTSSFVIYNCELVDESSHSHFISFRYYEGSEQFLELNDFLADLGFVDFVDAKGLEEEVTIVHGDRYAYITNREVVSVEENENSEKEES